MKALAFGLVLFSFLSFDVDVVQGQAHGEYDKSAYEEFVDGVGSMLYFLAWPTATYESASFEGISWLDNGVDVKIKLHGKSAFSDGHLWTEVVLEVRGGEVSDLRWGRNDAVLAQPGETMQAFGEVLADINAEYDRTHPGGPSDVNTLTPVGGGVGFYFKNGCRHPLRLAIHYRNTREQWKTEGWWKFSPRESAYLSAGGQRLKTKNSIWYYYAETTDGSDLVWQGELIANIRGTQLKMRKAEDQEGDNDWTAVCDAQ